MWQNSKYDKAQKLKMWQSSATQNMTSKKKYKKITQNVTKPKNSNGDTAYCLKLWQNSH